MPLPESVRIEVEPGGDGTYFLYAHWTPPGRPERSLIVGVGNSAGSPDLIAASSSLHNLLLHVYEAGLGEVALEL